MNEVSQEPTENLFGKLLMVGFDGLKPDGHLKRMIREYRVGGVILFRRNVRDANQVRQLTVRINEIADSAGYELPPLIAVDQEGGMVNRITDGVALSPGNMAIGATGDVDAAREIGEIVGRELKSMGINMNLAPVLDLIRDPDNHLGTRCFTEDPELVGALGRAYSNGLAEQGVIPVGKHFLGYGGSTTDPHEALPHNDLSREELEPAIKPFRISSNSLGAVMSAHIVLEGLDKTPATMSEKIITGILREDVNFKGPVVTDCLEMGAIQNRFGTKKAAEKTINAGGDLLIVSHHEEEQIKAINAIKSAVKKQRITNSRVQESIERLGNLRDDLEGSDESGFSLERDHQRMVEIAGSAITVIRDDGLPLDADEDVALVSPELTGRSLSGVQDEEYRTVSIFKTLTKTGVEAKEITYGEETELSEVLREVKDVDKVVLLALEPEGFIKSLVSRLVDRKAKVILAAVAEPWNFVQLPVEGLLFTYGHRSASMEALGEVLGGELAPKGNPPVRLSGFN